MTKIALLADHPETIATLVDWFRAQWPVYYANSTTEEMTRDFLEDTNRDEIPVRLVAFVGGEPAGTIILRDHVIETMPECRPGLGGLLVIERFRGRGIATELVRAGMDLARDLGYRKIYATTVEARGILERLGWELVRVVAHDDERLLLYACKFGD
jgi:RimJ/RimL family protein N-acetyltransferase